MPSLDAHGTEPRECCDGGATRGVDLTQRLPHLRVLYCSGRLDHAPEDHGGVESLLRVMASLRITVVPVALRPPVEEPQSAQLRVSTLRPSGEWLSSTVSDPGQALEAARRMLDEAVHPDVRAGVHLENAGVDFSSGAPELLLTAVLPIAAAELDDTAEDWPMPVSTPSAERSHRWKLPSGWRSPQTEAYTERA